MTRKPKVLSDIGFRISGEDWTLKFSPDLKDDDGITEHSKQLITIDASLRGNKLRDIIMHELFEAASLVTGCTYGRSYPDMQDLYVMNHTAMNSVMMAVRSAYDDIVEVLGKSAKEKV